MSFGAEDIGVQILHQAGNSRSGRFANTIFYEGKNYWSNHIHKSYEIIYAIDGDIEVSARGRTERVSTNSFAIILPNEVHEVRSDDGARFWIGIYSEDYIHEFTKLQEKRVGLTLSFKCNDDILSLVKNHLIYAEHPSAYMTKACLYALCDEYISKTDFSARTDKQYSVMNRIIDYIESNFKNDISLADVAESIGYDYSYFSKTFSSLFATSFSDYVNIYRFNHAAMLLTESNIPICQVAKESGFKSVRSFNNVFKKMAQISPSDFRKATENESRIAKSAH